MLHFFAAISLRLAAGWFVGLMMMILNIEALAALPYSGSFAIFSQYFLTSRHTAER